MLLAKNSNFMHGFKSAILEKLKNCLVPMNPSKTCKGKLEGASFLPSKYLDRQCGRQQEWFIQTKFLVSNDKNTILQ